MARLALEDGTVVRGRSFAALPSDSVTGEVVFNTALCGYQEALSDPSYAGQILIMTAPMIGNYGVCDEDIESLRPQVAGLIVREESRVVSSHRAVGALGAWLASHEVPAISGVDTRALVRIIRQQGAMSAVISHDASLSDAQLVELARSAVPMSGQNLAEGVTAAEVGTWEDDLGEWNTHHDSDMRFKVVAIDCGAKANIYRHLISVGCEVVVVPYDSDAEAIRSHDPDGLFISNGPGDPSAVEATIETLRAFAGEIPTFGICLGHQLLALSLGATTYKLKFGHRGTNQPVRDLETGQVEITSQNHGFCVDEASLEAAGCVVTHRHLNDDTVAGFRHASKPIFAVQYHPEASPGPHDAAHLFRRFTGLMATARQGTC